MRECQVCNASFSFSGGLVAREGPQLEGCEASRVLDFDLADLPKALYQEMFLDPLLYLRNIAYPNWLLEDVGSTAVPVQDAFPWFRVWHRRSPTTNACSISPTVPF